MGTSFRDSASFRLAYIGGILTLAGTLFSGPLALLAVSAVQPQPAWSGALVYVSNYHPIQSLTFYFGFLLIIGSVLMIASMYVLDRQSISTLLALIFTAVACGLIGLNYFSQATFVPALIRHYTPALEPTVTVFAVTNPISIFWAIEMWGYGFLGLGTWLASGFFRDRGIERVAKILFVLNGIVSIVGAVWTSIHLEWVLSSVGLVSYAVWNVIYLVLAAVFLAALWRRQWHAEIGNHPLQTES